ncbi:MAG: STAS domain-containing protein [Bacteroidales bacterium]|jgi:anti-sigma B factor antagonist
MEVKIEKTDAETMVKMIGRLDSMNSGEVEKAVAPVMESDMKNVIIDCSEFDYISSSGLRIFLTMLKEAKKKGGKLSIRNMKAEIKSVFDITGFTPLFIFE